ncbi:g-D-glutamyl-meso-diaminopimelate peptidase [Paenibacillus sp. yr247]|uniref:M14 family metallopeptidase n=1 Tax=Paenibacillus sp. yr247 TaxID=1761880 RepID=UPI00087E89B7|nr:M14 family metallocarboxypeptidase [Paenibacillus sp. yr247]SDN17817.1 g-D-glutamyl-meso-diaminopimelate peptidase [Paenibacillus sp. yr247]
MLGYGYWTLCEELNRLGKIYPFLHFEVIGESVMGKSIPALRIGQGAKELHINASFHANEWITTPLLMQFVEDLACSYARGTAWQGSNIRRLLSEYSLWVVPMVNPDGVELVLHGVNDEHPFRETLLDWNGGSPDFSNWKANIRGVDLNDQFPAHWEEEAARRGQPGPGERDYGGVAPLTEPEAIALAHFTECHPFELVVALHTQGREIYWNYRDYEPSESEAFAERLALASGYQAVKLVDSDAGYKDWFIQQFRKPGFTIEVGVGVNPLPVESFATLYEEMVPILLTAMDLQVVNR